MFGSPKSLRDEHRSIVEEIETGEPIEARHAQPVSVDQDGFESLITDADRAAFAKTRFFGIVLNKWLSWGGGVFGAEQPSPHAVRRPCLRTNVRSLLQRSPNRSRLPLRVALLRGAAVEEPVDMAVRVDVENAQFYSYADLRGLLRALTFSVASRSAGADDAARRDLEVDRALLGALWEITRLPNELHRSSSRPHGPGNTLIETGEAEL